MSSSRFRLNRNRVFGLLLAASAAAMLLPASWSDPLKHVMQLLVPAQDLARTVSMKAVRHAREATESAASEADRGDTLEMSLAAAVVQIRQLQEEVSRLQALRDRHVPPAIPLLDAKVVATDVASWRDSALVSRGSLRGVSWRDWVASRFFIDRGTMSDVNAGQAVIGAECLLGRVEQVSPYMSRVQLFSDVDSPRIEVRIAAVRGEEARLLDYSCSLHGLGRGLMMISNVEAAMIDLTEPDGEADADAERGRIRIGDFVFSAPGQLGLPTPLAVGKIVRIEENATRRLVYNLTVEPLVRVADIGDVYVIPLVPGDTVPIP